MRKSTSKFVLSATIVFALALTISCNDTGAPSELVDHWLYLSGTKQARDMELFKDGTGVCDGSSVSWKVENKRFILQSSRNGLASDYKLSDSKLTLIYNNGDSTVFAKKTYYEKLKQEIREKIKKGESVENIEAKDLIEEILFEFIEFEDLSPQMKRDIPNEAGQKPRKKAGQEKPRAKARQ